MLVLLALCLLQNLHPTVLRVFVVVFACIDRHEQVLVQNRLSGMFTAVG